MSLTSNRVQAKSCFELPYGYKIDLDFIKYCESLTLSKPDLTDNGTSKRHQRRQRHSVEVMLGLEKSFNSAIDDMKHMDVIYDTPTPPTPPPRSHRNMMNSYRSSSIDRSELEDAVNDFEKTFENSHQQKNQHVSNFTNIGDGCISPSQPCQKSTELSFTSNKSNLSSMDQANIFKIMNHVEDLEERIKLIPLLQLQVDKLKLERDQLRQTLEEKKSNAQVQKQNSQNVQLAFQPQRISPVSLNPLNITPKKILRTVSTNTAQITLRDTGVSPMQPTKVNRAVVTDCSVEVSKKNTDRLYTEKDLEEKINSDRLKSKKVTCSIGVQYDLISESNPPDNEKTRHLAKSELKSVSIPSTSLDNNTNSSNLSLSSLLKETKKEKATQCLVSSVEKSTDVRDLQQPKVSKFSSTQDLTRYSNIGMQTDAPPVVQSRSISTNTSTTIVRSIGIATDDELIEKILDERRAHAESKIPTRITTQQSSAENRNLKRQDTFTVVQTPISSVRTKIIDECPAEKLLRLTMTSSNGQEENPPSNIEEAENNAKNTVNASRAERPCSEGDNNNEESEIIEVDQEISTDVHFVEFKEDQIFECEEDQIEDDEEDEDDDDEYDEDEDKFYDEDTQFVNSSRPPPTSISVIRLCQQNRPRIKPSKETMSALKVLDDNLKKNDFKEDDIRNAREIAACEWFQISSTKDSQPNNIEDFLDYFEEQSWELLTFMVNLADKNGNTALHYAVSHKNFDAVSILLDSKVCDVNKTNNAGYTCVMLVSLAKELIHEHQTVVKRLFKLSDVNIRASKNQQTALMLSVSHGNFLITTLLVEASADINIQDDDGSTALMCAAEHGFGDIVKYLLAQPECDSTIQDIDGNTALKIALESGYHDTGCLLYAHEHILRNKAPLKRTGSIKSSTGSLNTQR